MMRTIVHCTGLALLVGLAACTEKPQTQASRRADTPAAQGTGTAYVAPDWKAGDQASWDEQMRTRAQRGQDEYARVSGR